MAFSVSYVYEILDRFSAPLKKINQKVKGFSRRAEAAAVKAAKFGKSLVSTKRQAKGFGLEVRSSQLQVYSFGLATLSAKKRLWGFEGTFDSASRKVKRFSARIAAAKRKIGAFGHSLVKVGDKMSSVGRSMTTGITLVGAAIAGLAIKAAADFEQFEVSFGVMLGNMRKGRGLMQDLASFGERTPFELKGITKAAKKLLAFGVEGDNVVNRLQMLGDVSAGIGAPLADMAHIFGKVKAKGKAMTEEIMQFAERGVPILDVLADRIKHKFAGNMDKAKAAIFKMAEKGKIKFKDIQKAFEQMTKKGGKFHNMMVLQSGTMGGLFSNLRDAMDMALVRIGKVIIKTFGLKNIVKTLSEKIEHLSKRFENWAKANPKLAKMALIVAGLVMTLGPLLLTLGLIVKVMGFLGIGIGAVSAPILIIVGVVALLVLMFRRWAATNHPVLKSLQRLWRALAPIGNVIGFLIDRLGAFINQLFGTSKEAGDLAHMFDIIGLALIPVIAGVTALVNSLFGESNDTVFANMMGDLEEFRKGTSMVSQVYDGMINRVSDWMTSVMGFFSMLKTEILSVVDKVTSLVSGFKDFHLNIFKDIADKVSGAASALSLGTTGALSGKTGERTGDNKSQENAQKQKIEISGRIGVSASGSSKIEDAGIGLNQGANLATVM